MRDCGAPVIFLQIARPFLRIFYQFLMQKVYFFNQFGQAARILDHRKTNPIRSLAELAEVTGLSAEHIDELRPFIDLD